MKKYIIGTALALVMSTPALATYYSAGVTVDDYDPLIRTNKVATVEPFADYDSAADYNNAVAAAKELVDDARDDYVEYEANVGYSAFGLKPIYADNVRTSADGVFWAQGTPNRGTCTVNTTSSQNQYWVEHTGIMDFSDVNESLAYHRARTDGNNMSAAVMCWMQWLVNHDVDQAATDATAILGFDPGYYADGLTSDYDYIAYYVQLDYSQYVAVPQSFISLIPSHDLDEFWPAWLVVTGVSPGTSDFDRADAVSMINGYNNLLGYEGDTLNHPNFGPNNAANLNLLNTYFSDEDAGVYKLTNATGDHGYYELSNDGVWSKSISASLAQRQASYAADWVASIVDYTNPQ